MHLQPPKNGKAVEALAEPLLEKSKEELIAENARLKVQLNAAEKVIKQAKITNKMIIDDIEWRWEEIEYLEAVITEYKKLKAKKETT